MEIPDNPRRGLTLQTFMSSEGRVESLALREKKLMKQLSRKVFLRILRLAFFGALALPMFAEAAPVHGLWLWGTLTVLKEPRSVETLLVFCQSNGINEVYVSVSDLKGGPEDKQFTDLIAHLHQSNIRVEALMGDSNADEPGAPREKLLEQVRGIVHFNQMHAKDRFDGIHLDIEPQQRPENYGPDNIKFLPGLVDAYRDVRKLAEPAHLTVNADIPTKVLKGDHSQRRKLLSALPRLTLMLYELSSPDDGESVEKKIEKLRTASSRYLKTAFEGLDDSSLAKLSIGLRTADYGDLLPRMLKTLDEAHRTKPHYGGWARQSYNDYLKAAH